MVGAICAIAMIVACAAVVWARGGAAGASPEACSADVAIIDGGTQDASPAEDVTEGSFDSGEARDDTPAPVDVRADAVATSTSREDADAPVQTTRVGDDGSWQTTQ